MKKKKAAVTSMKDFWVGSLHIHYLILFGLIPSYRLKAEVNSGWLTMTTKKNIHNDTDTKICGEWPIYLNLLGFGQQETRVAAENKQTNKQQHTKVLIDLQ